MDGAPIEPTTSILELLYLIRAKNKGDISFAEWVGCASQWARDVIAEYELGQAEEKQELVLTSRDVSGRMEG